VPFAGAVVATCAAAGLMTLLMGLTTNYPMCLAAGMGLNAVVAFGIVKGMGLPWQTAMGVVVLEGIVVLVLTATRLREVVMESIPRPLKSAIAVGIGIFITFIGFQQGGLVQPHPATFVTMADLTAPVALLSVIGLLVTGALVLRRVKGALLIGIAVTAAAGMLPVWHLPAGVGAPAQVAAGAAAQARWGALVPLPAALFQVPTDWSTFFAFDLRGALTLQLLPVVFAFFMTDFFDTMGTAIAVGAKAGYLDREGRIPRIRQLLMVDSLAAITGGAFGCSSNTCYIESSAGVGEGGRTGLTAVVCGLCFLLAAFFSPLIAVVGGGVMTGPDTVLHPVTAAALIIVGFLMMDSVREIDWANPEEGLPAFMVMVTMPLTFSITHGIGAGFVTHVTWKALAGRGREVRPFLWFVAGLFVLVFAMPALQRHLGLK
jgi:AGZA family xanthine/uracil permease-like MFS transporter